MDPINDITYTDDDIYACIDGLDVEFDYLKELIEERGWMGAASIMGYKINKYDNLIAAGRMVIIKILKTVNMSVVEYATNLRPYLRPEIYKFLIMYSHPYEKLCEQYFHHLMDHDWFSANSLGRVYLSRDRESREVCETPLHLYIRLSATLSYRENQTVQERWVRAESIFKNLVSQMYTPASPTIFNAGFIDGQMSSCFLITIEDTLQSILYSGVGDCGMISKTNGGLGMDISRIRHSEVGYFGSTRGVMPWVYLYNGMIRAVDQGGRRPGAMTIYLRPHHFDTIDFIESTLKTGDQYMRAHDINTALWMPWLFWERLENGGEWSLFCPNKTKELNDCYGVEWEEKYIQYENDKSIPRTTTTAFELIKRIVDIQGKSGMPYILNGDASNFKSNQKGLGYIRSGNLCLEVIQYTSADEIAVCNLASISLKAFVKGPRIFDDHEYDVDVDEVDLDEYYDFQALWEVVHEIVENLNNVIDSNYYPVPQAENSNMQHRPIGIGVQGLDEAIKLLDLTFHDPNSPTQVHPITSKLNKMIFACIEYSGLCKSNELAVRHGKHSSFDKMEMSKGKLQFDLWAEEYQLLKSLGRIDDRIRKEEDDIPIDPSEWGQVPYEVEEGGYTIEPSWDSLKEAIQANGTRNSLITCVMPTASSAQPLRNCESVEAHQSNIYSRLVLNGNYPVINSHLIHDLEELGMWNDDVSLFIQACNGSLSKITEYIRDNLTGPNEYNLRPISEQDWERLDYLKEKYKTMWEISCKVFLKMAADRGRYIDQSQSTNLYIEDPTADQLVACHIYSNKLGLKTNMYYLRQLGIQPVKFTVPPEMTRYVTGLEVTAADEEHIETQETVIPDNPFEEVHAAESTRKTVNGKEFICTDDVCISCQ